jgi:hypothetical protein
MRRPPQEFWIGSWLWVSINISLGRGSFIALLGIYCLCTNCVSEKNLSYNKEVFWGISKDVVKSYVGTMLGEQET